MFFLTAEEPEILLELATRDAIYIRAGNTIKIPATVTGRPTPKTIWDFEGEAKKFTMVLTELAYFYNHKFI